MQACINTAAFRNEMLSITVTEHKQDGSEVELEVRPKSTQGAASKLLVVLKVILVIIIINVG